MDFLHVMHIMVKNTSFAEKILLDDYNTLILPYSGVLKYYNTSNVMQSGI